MSAAVAFYFANQSARDTNFNPTAAPVAQLDRAAVS